MVCAWQWAAKIQNCEDLSLSGVEEHQRASNGRMSKRAKREKLMNIPHPCLYIAWMVSVLLDVGEV